MNIEKNKKIVYRAFDSYVSINRSNEKNNIEDLVFSKLWGWVVRDDYDLRMNYFRFWNKFQNELEFNDIKTYGKLSSETILKRKNNPHIYFISKINECIYEDLFLNNIIFKNIETINEKNKITKLIRNSVIRCFNENPKLRFSDPLIIDFIKKNNNYNSKIEKKNENIYSQSDCIANMSNYDFEINQFRINNWKLKFLKIIA